MAVPIADVREISRIAYGFIGSKALFSALNLDLFGRLAGGKKTFERLVGDTGVAPNRLTKAQPSNSGNSAGGRPRLVRDVG